MSHGIIHWLGLRVYQTVNNELDFIFISCKKIRKIINNNLI
jgi:hypothetical protein